MSASGKSSRRPGRPRDAGETRAARPPPPLVRRDVIAGIGEALARSGAGELGEALIGEADRHAHYLERCAVEAEAVLRGRIEAATRLWLLLREPIPAGPAIPPSVLDRIGGDSLRDPPVVLGGDPLLRLVAGTVRAAGPPARAEAMLEALGRLLAPFFLLDLAGVAATQAGHGFREPLHTLVVAWGAPRWAPPPPPPPGGPRPPADRSGPAVIRPIDPLLGPFEAAATSTIGSWISRWPCLGSTGLKMSTYDLLDPQYGIESIDKPQACPGDTIRISGHDFGPEGLVSFEPPPPNDPVSKLHAGDAGLLAGVKAKRWTDTEIDVVVPPWAIAGGVHLNTFKIKKDLCATIYVHRLGNSFPFKGGLALFESVSIHGEPVDLESKKQINLIPGQFVAVAWKATGGPTAKVKVQLVDGATVLWEQGGLPADAWSLVLPVPLFGAPTGAALVFTVTSACGATAPLVLPVWVSIPPNLSITYVEVTQGVQGSLDDVLAGRALPTVANKDTAVRVHMACDRGGWYDNRLDRITGALYFDGKALVPTNSNLFVTIAGLSDAKQTNDTLNFKIPAAWATPGPHVLEARVVVDDPSGRIAHARVIGWTWMEKAPMPVRAVHMGSDYADIDQVVRDCEMLRYLRSVLDYLPTPLTDIAICSLRYHAPADFFMATGDWSTLRQHLLNTRIHLMMWGGLMDAALWLGIVPDALVGNSRTRGIATRPGIVALAREAYPDSGAHELGHCRGRRHIHLPVGEGEPAPFYTPVDNGGLLRRPPFNVRKSVAEPLPVGDLMGYFLPRYAGVDTWTRLFLDQNDPPIIIGGIIFDD